MRLIDADALNLDREVELADDWKTAHEIANCVKYAPTIDAAPVVHGRWIYENDDPSMIPCSMCGYQVFRYNNTPYCPHCGAKTDLEEQQDD